MFSCFSKLGRVIGSLKRKINRLDYLIRINSRQVDANTVLIKRLEADNERLVVEATAAHTMMENLQNLINQDSKDNKDK